MDMKTGVIRYPVTIMLGGEAVDVGEVVCLPKSTNWRGRLFAYNSGQFFCSEPNLEDALAVTLSRYSGPQDHQPVDPVAF